MYSPPRHGFPMRALEAHTRPRGDYNDENTRADRLPLQALGGRCGQEDDSAECMHPCTKRGPFFEAADIPDDACQDGKLANRTVADRKRLAAREEPFVMAWGFWRPHPCPSPRRRNSGTSTTGRRPPSPATAMPRRPRRQDRPLPLHRVGNRRADALRPQDGPRREHQHHHGPEDGGHRGRTTGNAEGGMMNGEYRTHGIRDRCAIGPATGMRSLRNHSEDQMIG